MSRAIVVGGSIAGMCSARVLREFYDEVVVLDRDHYPARRDHRAGVPQSRHAHALLVRGQRELERLFPGFVSRMCAAGALRFDAGRSIAFRRAPGWQCVGSSGVETLWSSRVLLEHTVRGLLLERGDVELRQGCSATGLAAAVGQPRVTGVRYRYEGGAEQTLAADLVVDASGRATHADSWLAALGVRAPETQSVNAHLAYASRFYRAPAAARRPADWWWRGLWVDPEPGRPRGGVVFPIEDDCWLVTAIGIGDPPPTDEPGYLAFLESLSTPVIAQALARAQPLSSIYGNRSTANVYRRYDQWERGLPGFIALGDSVCAFNPVYGQGMSTSAASAGILRRVLGAKGVDGAFERAFFRAQAEFLRTPWDLATSADRAWMREGAPATRMRRWLRAYTWLALESTHYDPRMLRHLVPVFHLTGSPLRFFEPRFMVRAVASGLARRLRVRLFGWPDKPQWPPVPNAKEPAAGGSPRAAQGVRPRPVPVA